MFNSALYFFLVKCQPILRYH